MIGAAPVPAIYFDGHTAQRHPVFVSVSRDGRGLSIDLQSPGGTPMLWPLDRLRSLADQARADSLTLTLHADSDDETPRDPARLVVNDPNLQAWLRLSAPSLKKRDVRRGTVTKIVRRFALAAASIGIIVFVILPRMSDYLADRMPLETEVRFGEAVISQMERFLGGREGSLVCTGGGGKAALDRLAQRLTEGQDLKYELKLSVLNHPMVNAFAAPGGHVVILRGLLDKADNAEEVAAVLAHEIGHVEARDPTRLMLRAAGSAGIVSIVLGDVSGGTVIGILGDQLLQTSYTRAAEKAADAFAIAMLNRAAISSEPFGDFFDKLAKLEGIAIPEYFSSHPSSANRAERAKENARNQGITKPALSTSDWQALKKICAG